MRVCIRMLWGLVRVMSRPGPSLMLKSCLSFALVRLELMICLFSGFHAFALDHPLPTFGFLYPPLLFSVAFIFIASCPGLFVASSELPRHRTFPYSYTVC